MKQTSPPTVPAWRLPVLLAALGVLGWFSFSLLGRHPISMVVYRGGDSPAGCRVSLSLTGRESAVEEIVLTASQKREVTRAIAGGDTAALGALSRRFDGEGRWAAAPGGEVAGDWPWYFGAGRSSLSASKANGGWLDNLSLPEKTALALFAGQPAAVPWAEIPTEVEEPVDQQAPTVNPTAETLPGDVPTPVAALRVQIYNGCGIRGAADSVSRAAQAAGFKVLSVGNADDWSRSQTTVQSSVGLPVALEEFVGRMGLDPASVKEPKRPKNGVDVVIIVGRDYKKIRERLRDRTE